MAGGRGRANAASYHVGDVLRYVSGSDSLGLTAKSYATVLAVDEDSNLITVQRADGKPVTYDPARLRGVAMYAPEPRSFAVGDRIQFTTPWREKDIATRDVATITYLDAKGNIRVQLDDSKRTLGWNLKDQRHLDYAYAMTSYSSQGATVDRVLIHIDTGDTQARALVDDTLAYVATSRPRYDAQIFTDDAKALRLAVSRQHQNSTALSREEVADLAMSV